MGALHANALAVFPGGLGTLDELFEILTLKQTPKTAGMPVILFCRKYWDKIINFRALADLGTIDRATLHYLKLSTVRRWDGTRWWNKASQLQHRYTSSSRSQEGIIMAVEGSDPAATAAYYDDAAISKFYEACWGGSDIHIGLYASGDETVSEASAAMTRHQLERTGVRPDQRVLDIACGFGGTLRALASMGCRATGYDISKVNVDYARKANADAGLNSLIDVAVGDFHAIDSEADAWDVVICQDSLIHSPDRPKVFAEVYRILRSGGAFGFSDILTGEDADLTIVDAAFARLGAPAGTTSSDYQEMARAAGFEVEFAEERASDIKAHYDKLAKALAKPIAGLDDRAVAAISASISRWQAALAGGHITWACFVARKPA